jgi:hypothetical protein
MRCTVGRAGAETSVRLSSLAVPRLAIASRVGLVLAHKCTPLRAPVPALSLQVVDPTRCVQPDDDVSRAMGLSRRLGSEEGKGLSYGPAVAALAGVTPVVAAGPTTANTTDLRRRIRSAGAVSFRA